MLPSPVQAPVHPRSTPVPAPTPVLTRSPHRPAGGRMANPPSRSLRRVLLVVLALASIAGAARAQVEAVATRGANLRAGPSRQSHRLDLVRAGDVVTLLLPAHEAGY